MVITQENARNILAGCRQTLGLPEEPEGFIDDVLLAALLRRTAGHHCPCSRATLRASVLDSLQMLSKDTDEMSLYEQIEIVIEGLIAGGDLIELNDVVTYDPEAKGTWVFAAPPSFVVRPSGSIFLLGIVPDQDVFLPESLASRISYVGLTRIISPMPSEDLPGELSEQGMQQLSQDTWLKSPRAERPEDLLKRFKRQLAEQPPSGVVNDLQIMDQSQSITYYRGRWTSPGEQTGTFVAKRPQEFGNAIWCFAELKAGAVVRLLDLPLKKSRWRGCDVAWYLQMAIDHCNQTPQLYRCRHEDHGVRLDFFSPLPQWSHRRLMILGRTVQRKNSLMSYQLPSTEAATEEAFLQNRLWLSRLQNTD